MSSSFAGLTKYNLGYKAQIVRQGKVFYLGSFRDENGAAAQYDRGVKLTRPWANRDAPLNFPDTEGNVINEKYLDPKLRPDRLLIEMMAFLRHNYPSSESDYLETRVVRENLPLDLITDLNEALSKLAYWQEQVKTRGLALNAALTRKAYELATLQKNLDFLKGENTRQAEQIGELEASKVPKVSLLKRVGQTLSPEDEAARKAYLDELEKEKKPIIAAPLAEVVKPWEPIPVQSSSAQV